MRVLQVSKFLRHVGGVETYVRWLGSALQGAGHEVGFFGMDLPADSDPVWVPGQYQRTSPDRDFHGSTLGKAMDGAAAVYSPAVGRRFRAAIDEFEPDVIHFHGTCYQLTSSVFQAAARRHVPAMVTAHEYKLICANQRFWDDASGGECYECLGRRPHEKARAILQRRCVKDSRGASLIASAEQVVSGRMMSRSDLLIHAPSQYMLRSLRVDGFSEARTRYQDLPWEQPSDCSRAGDERSVVLFLGRLSVEKGVDRLIKAWSLVESHLPGVTLQIAGDGPDRARLVSKVQDFGLTRVEFSGRYTPAELNELMARAITSVHPSVWAENSPFTVRESLARGVPAIVSDRGGLPEMVCPETGAVVDPNDSESLATAIVDEVHLSRAGSAGLRSAVDDRLVSHEDHLRWLLETYSTLHERGVRRTA